ncbi:MAG: LpqB family beta-propeller domain-containing protein [Gemmatimonadales bacterium]
MFLPSRSTLVCSLLFGLASAALVTPDLAGQAAPADTGWDVTKPRGQTREIDFSVSEGTWMSVDLTPDGRWIVFDLLGHIYRVPAAGGQAESLTQESGIAINFQPRVSPDGKTIAFVSDRKGQNNLWIMDADGRNPRPVYLDPKSRVEQPSWSADGEYLFAVKRGGLVNRSIWMFHKDGGQGVEVVASAQGRVPSRPVVSPDGRYLYYEMYTGRFTGEFGKEGLLSGTMQLVRRDLETGQDRAITVGTSAQQDRGTSGSAYAQMPSPDGKWLAFVRRIPDGTFSWKGHRFGPRSALWLRNLDTGEERLLMDPVELDMAEEGIPLDGTYPLYRWAEDGTILLTQGGKLRRVTVATGEVATIPFTARVHRIVSEQAWARTRLSDGPVRSRYIRWASASPDGRRLAFHAVGRNWVMDLPNGTPRRLTPADFGPLEYGPTWSPDGQSIAFVSWDDQRQGQVWRVPAGGGAPTAVTREAGEYYSPVFSPDGRQLVFLRGSGATLRQRTASRSGYLDVMRLDLANGTAQAIAQIGGATGVPSFGFSQVPRPSFGPDGRVFYTVLGAGGGKVVGVLHSVRPDGSDHQEHLKAEYADDVTPSPDGKWVAFSQAGDVFVAPFPYRRTGEVVPQVSKSGGAFPTTRLTTEGGIMPRWRDGSTLDYVSADKFYTHRVGSSTDTLTVRLEVGRELGRGSIALTGGRIIPLNGGQVTNGTVVVTDGRISCVGRCSTRGVDRVVSVSGKTVIPGWIDMHAHHHREHQGMPPRHNFETAIYLAYGVTTTLDPAAWSQETFSSAEMVEAGEMIGPRIFATAENVTDGDGPGTNDIASLEVALREAARRKAWGATTLKQYLQPTRQQRQWVAEAGRQLGMMVTSEGSIDLMHKISMAMDGHTGFEHATALLPMYSDVTTFLGKTHTVNSHTPLVGGPGPWNEEYWWQESDIWKDQKAQRWLPWRQLIPHSRRHLQRPETDYPLGMMAQVIKDIIDAGGLSAIGSHGQEHGIASHWDAWMAARAMSPMEVLEMASMHGARFLGMEQDLGSIEVGKLGDLVVLNSNPLANIRSTVDIRYVMKAGVLYDANSLDEIWPVARPFGDYYWITPEALKTDDKPIDVWDRSR